MNSARFFYTALLEELASHGYIVAAIDHTYWGPGVAFSRGRTVPYEDGMDALDKLSSDEIDEMMWAGVSVMVADEVFVEKRIAYLDGDPAVSNPFRNRLDLSHVGVVGHSMVDKQQHGPASNTPYSKRVHAWMDSTHFFTCGQRPAENRSCSL